MVACSHPLANGSAHATHTHEQAEAGTHTHCDQWPVTLALVAEVCDAAAQITHPPKCDLGCWPRKAPKYVGAKDG